MTPYNLFIMPLQVQANPRQNISNASIKKGISRDRNPKSVQILRFGFRGQKKPSMFFFKIVSQFLADMYNL